MRTSTTLKAALAGFAAVVMLAFGADRASAQGPTPEGDTIQNIATAAYEDANGNTYSAEDTISLVVGFMPGVTITGTGSTSPLSPSTDESYVFTLTNVGNGVDTFQVSTGLETGLSEAGPTAYVLNGTTTFVDLAALNVALATLEILAGDDITIELLFDVAVGTGGQDLDLSMTVTSVRSGQTDTHADVVTPATAYNVLVTANDDALSNLPSNAGTVVYSVTFDVENEGTLNDTYTLAAQLSDAGATVTIVSVNGTPGASSSQAVNSGETATITVEYTVNDVGGGESETITLLATSQGLATVSDSDATTITVIRPAITMTKVAFQADGVTPLNDGDEVLPGDTIIYQITVTNGGDADAVTIEVSDPLAPSLSLIQVTGAEWTFDTSTTPGTVVATLTDGTLAPSESSSFQIQVEVD